MCLMHSKQCSVGFSTHLSEVFECLVASVSVSSRDDVFTVPYRGFLYPGDH